ncbi:hypothetical protein H9P43_005215 [Blastocladiella emersonii ATCC 22665]|nr:hypothetical protein H9P43_005215 [Blastocladiella emersonii ATCC 22665]
MGAQAVMQFALSSGVATLEQVANAFTGAGVAELAWGLLRGGNMVVNPLDLLTMIAPHLSQMVLFMYTSRDRELSNLLVAVLARPECRDAAINIIQQSDCNPYATAAVATGLFFAAHPRAAFGSLIRNGFIFMSVPASFWDMIPEHAFKVVKFVDPDALPSEGGDHHGQDASAMPAEE